MKQSVEVAEGASKKKTNTDTDQVGFESEQTNEIEKLKVKNMNGIVNGLSEEKVHSSGKRKKKDLRAGHLNGTEVGQSELIDTLGLKSKPSPTLSSQKNHVKKPVVNNSIKKTETVPSSSSSSSNVNTISNSQKDGGKNKSKSSKVNSKKLNNNNNVGDTNGISSEILSQRLRESDKIVNVKIEDKSESTIEDFSDNVVPALEGLNLEDNREICLKSDEVSKKDRAKDEEDVKKEGEDGIEYVQYQSELQMPMIMKIIQKDLSEPYSIYTYRYFIHNWPNLCFLAMAGDQCVGAIVCKLDLHRKVIKRGYIAMLAVDKNYRKKGIGSTLVRRAIQEMIIGDADEVVLETEITNKPALKLYEALGFVRDKRLFRYYLNGVDALRLKLWLR